MGLIIDCEAGGTGAGCQSKDLIRRTIKMIQKAGKAADKCVFSQFPTIDSTVIKALKYVSIWFLQH